MAEWHGRAGKRFSYLSRGVYIYLSSHTANRLQENMSCASLIGAHNHNTTVTIWEDMSCASLIGAHNATVTLWEGQLAFALRTSGSPGMCQQGTMLDMSLVCQRVAGCLGGRTPIVYILGTGVPPHKVHHLPLCCTWIPGIRTSAT